MGLYLPRAKLISPRPTQKDEGGLNMKRVAFQALTGATLTTALTSSAWRLAFA
jgi:hypothetical protein